MEKKKLAVLFGGVSSEHEISLQSAAAVLDVIDRETYEVYQLGITKRGQWLLYPGGSDAIRAGTWQQNNGCLPAILSPDRDTRGLVVLSPEGYTTHTIDIAFPILHGRGGEDGTVQGLLALAGIPVAGCGLLASALSMDKAIAHILAQQVGVPCPRFASVYKTDGDTNTLAAFITRELGTVPLPWFVKPAREGSSFGITRIENTAELPGALQTAFKYDDKVVVEEGVDGFEIGCAVIGGHVPQCGEVDSIRLSGGYFDTHEKYSLQTSEIVCPAPIPALSAQTAKEYALAIYRALECSGLARIDFFYRPDGQIVFNEINTIPGMTQHSRWPGMIAKAGTPFPAAIAQLLQTAVQP